MTSVQLLLMLSVGLGCPTLDGPGDGGPPELDPWTDLETLYRSGLAFGAFLDQADRRREMWIAHYETGQAPPSLIERARAVGGTWRLLAIAEDWCSDSVNTIPFLALLSERVPGLDLRIIDSEAGRALMQAHRTPDGRAATPTVILLDAEYRKAGCWVERPAELQAWALEHRPRLDDREFLRRKMSWYREDGGRSTVREIVELLERAAGGQAGCEGG